MTQHKPINGYIHPLDVLGYIQRCSRDDQRLALCIVTGTEGGGVRAPGALIAINESGDIAGYMSNGCVDADLILQAQAALKDGAVRAIRYGAGSPFKDIRLPCGGGVDVLIIPSPDERAVDDAVEALCARRAATLAAGRRGDLSVLDHTAKAGWSDGGLGDVFHIPLLPRLRLRIAGNGVEVLALTASARAAQCGVIIQSGDPLCLNQAKAMGLPRHKLETPEAPLPAMVDDPFTAFVMLFHDHDWEAPLLKQALSGAAFYVGAMGSRATHIKRCEGLTELGVSPMDMARIRAPIGVIAASRDSSVLAVSILAEIMIVWRESYTL